MEDEHDTVLTLFLTMFLNNQSQSNISIFRAQSNLKLFKQQQTALKNVPHGKNIVD